MYNLNLESVNVSTLSVYHPDVTAGSGNLHPHQTTIRVTTIFMTPISLFYPSYIYTIEIESTEECRAAIYHMSYIHVTLREAVSIRGAKKKKKTQHLPCH